MLTEKDYCDYETCVALIEMGFVGTSRYYYDKKNHKLHITNYGITYTVRTASASDYVLAIHLYDAQKWLREKLNIHISTKPYPNEGGLMWMFEIRKFSPYLVSVIVNKTGFYDSEEALLEGIKEAIKILKEE